MHDTFAGDGHGRPNLAAGYMHDEPVPSMELDTVSMGAGDIWSTVRDLDRWNRGVLGDVLLTPASRERMFTPHAEIEGFPIEGAYGYGWMIVDMLDRTLYAHSGDNVGFNALNVVVPSEQLRVVLLTNDYPADVLAVVLPLLQEALA